jgi:hypothetical protein
MKASDLFSIFRHDLAAAGGEAVVEAEFDQTNILADLLAPPDAKHGFLRGTRSRVVSRIADQGAGVARCTAESWYPRRWGLGLQRVIRDAFVQCRAAAYVRCSSNNDRNPVASRSVGLCQQLPLVALQQFSGFSLLDDLVGTHQNGWGYGKTERLGGLEVQAGRLVAFENRGGTPAGR